MPIRLIQAHGSTGGRPNWLAPVVFILAIIGGVFVLFSAALIGAVMLAAGALARLFLPAPSQPGGGRKSILPAFATQLLHKLFHRAPAPRAGWETEENWSPSDSQDRPDGRTISMDRDPNGVWRK
jgi:hypothetical protein